MITDKNTKSFNCGLFSKQGVRCQKPHGVFLLWATGIGRVWLAGIKHLLSYVRLADDENNSEAWMHSRS